MNIKEKLLSLDVVEDNEFLKQYCDLIESNKNNTNGERHHILPRFYFRYNNLEIDNSDDNLVYLSKENHIKAHKLLFQCGKYYFKFYNGYTLSNMSPEDKIQYNENNKTQRKNRKGFYLVFKDGKAKHIPKEKLEEYINGGWVRGMFYKQYTYNGETHNILEWSKIFNLPIEKTRRIITYKYKNRQQKSYTYNGETHTYNDWCKILRISRGALENRINKNSPIDKRIDFHKKNTIKRKSLTIRDDAIMFSLEYNTSFGTIEEFCKQFKCNKENLKKNIYKGIKTYGSHWILK